MSRDNSEEYAEFRGSTSAKLEIIFNEIKGLSDNVNRLNDEINSLKQWKAWTLGMGATAGFLAGVLKDFVKF